MYDYSNNNSKKNNTIGRYYIQYYLYTCIIIIRMSFFVMLLFFSRLRIRTTATVCVRVRQTTRNSVRYPFKSRRIIMYNVSLYLIYFSSCTRKPPDDVDIRFTLCCVLPFSVIRKQLELVG